MSKQVENDVKCEHDFKIVKKSWQTTKEYYPWSGSTRVEVLDHSKEVLVCTKCLQVINPWL